MGKQALEGTRLNAFGMDPDDLTIIALDTDDGPEHPLYDERANLAVKEELVLDIMAQGVLEVVLVRKNGDVVEVAAGRQRVKAAREANKRLKREGLETVRVPCMVRRGDDGAMMGVGISENELRWGDNLTNKAKKCQRYLDKGHSEKEAAVRFGVSTFTIKNWLKLGDLSSKVVKAIETEKIPESAGYELASLSRQEQEEALGKLLEAGGGRVTGSKVAQATKAAKKAKKAKKGASAEEADFVPPGKRLINKVLRIDEQRGKELNGEFVRGIRWVLGDIGPSSIAGLTDIIREAEGGKEE